MKDKCCRCQRDTSRTYQLWEEEPRTVCMCKTCQEQTIPERSKQKKRDNLAKVRAKYQAELAEYKALKKDKDWTDEDLAALFQKLKGTPKENH